MKKKRVILELGSFWSYYSLWFLSVVEQAKAILVEPLEGALEAGRRNFDLNGCEGTFIRAAIGDEGLDHVAFDHPAVDVARSNPQQVGR